METGKICNRIMKLIILKLTKMSSKEKFKGEFKVVQVSKTTR